MAGNLVLLRRASGAVKLDFGPDPGTTSFRPPKKYFVSFYLLSSPIVLVVSLYYLSVQEQHI